MALPKAVFLGVIGVICFGLLGLGDEWRVESRWSFPAEDIRGMPHSLSPDGALLLTWSNEAGICLYRTEDLSPVGCFRPEGVEGQMWLKLPSIAWSQDGKYALFATADGRAWRIGVDEGILEWLPTSVPAEHLALSPDGGSLAVGGGGAIVVAPPGALAEAPVARYRGILRGLVWCGAGLYYGVLAPDRKTFQVWTVFPRGNRAPELLWSYPYPDLLLKSVSPDGRYVWVGLGLLDLEAGELLRVSGEHTLTSFAFSSDAVSWLYSYQTVKDLAPWWVLAIRPAGTAPEKGQVLLEGRKQITILGWSPAGLVGLLLAHRTEPNLLFLNLASKD